MRNATWRIATTVMGLAGAIAAAPTVAWPGTPEGAPAGVVHLADGGDGDGDMHWSPNPVILPGQVPDIIEDLDPGTPPVTGDEMHW